jgi:hypothetical protein
MPQLVPESPQPPVTPPTFRDLISDAIRYWEPRRLVYNLVLVAIVLGWVAVTWPHLRSALTWPSALAVFVLAVLANVCYCTAYLVDITVQYSDFQGIWRKWRWALWVIGMISAGVIASYWIADEIYPAE